MMFALRLNTKPGQRRRSTGRANSLFNHSIQGQGALNNERYTS